MKKYLVTVEESTRYEIPITANTKEEAEEKASKIMSADDNLNQYLHDGEVTFIEADEV